MGASIGAGKGGGDGASDPECPVDGLRQNLRSGGVRDAEVRELALGASIGKTLQGQEIRSDAGETAAGEVGQPRRQPIYLEPPALGAG